MIDPADGIQFYIEALDAGRKEIEALRKANVKMSHQPADAFLVEARRLSAEIQELTMPGMWGDRALAVQHLTNELHELIELGEAPSDD